MKGPAMRLRKRLISLPLYAVITGLVCFLPGGCGRGQIKDKNLLVVNFEQGKTLRYKMTSGRDITLELTGSSTGATQSLSYVFPVNHYYRK
jgi:hypothetical protein